MSAANSARVFRGTPRNLTRLANVLRAGGLVAVPTETVYGLAANALDPVACRRIFRAKGRPSADPLIVHIHATEQLDELAVVNDAATRLLRAFWPGPLTLVLPKRPIVPPIVTAGLPSVAVRMPSHPLFCDLLRRAGLPLAAPSANPFGYISPTSAEHVRAGLGRRIAYILDGGPSAIGLESTIVDLRHPNAPRLLRPGAVTAKQLESVLGTAVVVAQSASSGAKVAPAQLAPGMLSRHYSPRTPASLHEHGTMSPPADSDGSEAWIFMRKPRASAKPNIFWLDANGSLPAAARRLFGVLREVDAKKFSHIHLEAAPGDGIGAAINDRLRRAAARR